VELLRLVAVVLAGTAVRTAAAEPSIDRVAPARGNAVLTADVSTSGLPGGTLEASLLSGLPSAIELRLEALDARDRPLGETRLYYRIAFDLWDELYRVEGPGVKAMPAEPAGPASPSYRFEDLAALRDFLAFLSGLPVVSWSAIDPAVRHRVRVGGRLHRIAPRETARLERWVAGGDVSRAAADPDGREVSVGLGDVIRFFYKGSKKEDGSQLAERFSAWFLPADLPPSGARGAPATPEAVE
jgi:hypothetical protein